MIKHGWSKFISSFHVGIQLAAAILFFFAEELDRVFNLYLLLVPIIGITAVIVGAAWLAGVIRSLIRKDWIMLTSIVIAPLIVWSLFIALLRNGIDAHWLRFQINKSTYEAAVHALESPRHYSWDWGATGGAGVPNILNTLVYDETDQVGREKAGNGGNASVRNLGDHFYLITEIY